MISAKRTSVRFAKKHQSHISATPEISTKRTSVSSANKHQSQILFISTSKERTKYTVSSAIHRKRHITNHDDDSDDYDGGDVDGGDSDGWKTAIIQHTRTPKRFCR